jgi:1,4-dihydroxy-2-naphthoate octaprenyltransferase
MKLTLIHWGESRWRVLQPAIYLVSVLPVLVGALVFQKSKQSLDVAWVGLAVILIQHAINVFNDGTDWEKGADTEKNRSWVYFHNGNLFVLQTHAWMSLIVGLGLGVFLVIKENRSELLWVAIPLVALGLFYNHKQYTLSYTRWGEWVTGICYGPGVFGCLSYFISPKWSVNLVLGSVCFACLAVAVLLSHQPPQVLTDYAARKMSFAVRNGVEKTYFTSRVLTIICILLMWFLFQSDSSGRLTRAVQLGFTVLLLVVLPKRLSPPTILKTVTVQVVVLGLLLKGGTG